jgi:ABC-type nitrate/sulfonate/bicarbonate transport system substrate-binding protein
LVRLQAELDDLNVVLSFTEELPNLMANVMLTTNDYHDKNPEVIKDVIKALVTTYRKVYDDPEWFLERLPKVLPTVDQTDMKKVVELYHKYKVYPINGGLTEQDQKFTIDFFTGSGQLDPGLTPEMVYNRKLLDEVLKDIGTR